MAALGEWGADPGAGRQICLLPIAVIDPNPDQPRRAFDRNKLSELADSIAMHGLLQPITVRPAGSRYELVAGERRLRACALAGMTCIEAVIMEPGDLGGALLALIENLQRADLHFLEEAEAYRRLTARGVTQEELAKRLSRSPSAVANKLRLLKLSERVRALVLESGMSERHARALLRLPNEDACLRVAARVAAEGMTVAKTEALVAKVISAVSSVQPRGQRVISLMRDHRLYVNAIQGIVNQMRQSGLDADIEVSRAEAWLQVRVTIPFAKASRNKTP